MPVRAYPVAFQKWIAAGEMALQAFAPEGIGGTLLAKLVDRSAKTVDGRRALEEHNACPSNSSSRGGRPANAGSL